MLALEEGGRTALLGDETRVVRVHLASSISTVALGFESAQDVVIESGGKTALLVEEGAWGRPPRLLRVDLTDGTFTTLATLKELYFSISGLAIEPGGDSALVTAGATDLVRVNLADGSVTTVTKLLQGAVSVAIESGGATALVSGYHPYLHRVDLTSGAVTVVAPVVADDLAIEPGGSTVLLTQGFGHRLVRVDLTDGSVTTVVSDLYPPTSGGGRSSIAIEESGLSVLMAQTHSAQPSGRMLRIDLVTGAVTIVALAGLSRPGAYGGSVGGIAIETGGATALVADWRNGLVRVTLPQAP